MKFNKFEKIKAIREKLKKGKSSIGSWIQIPDASIAEIMGGAGFDWVAVDMEHGSTGVEKLPNLFRALELGQTVPLARVAQGTMKEIKDVMDAGAAGIIIPMIEFKDQLEEAISFAAWPPAGKRGVGFSRANMYGHEFKEYVKYAQSPFVVAMIESKLGVKNIKSIISTKNLDAVLIGPYDLSASLGVTAEFEHPKFKQAIDEIKVACKTAKIAVGVHVVQPVVSELQMRIKEGYRFIPYSLDSVMLNKEVHSENWSKF